MPQSLASIALHLVFSTKRREPLITPDVASRLHAFLGGTLRDCGCAPISVNGASDHVHCLFFLSRTSTVSEVVQRLKQQSSRWMKEQGSRFSAFTWQEGYGVTSVSASLVERVKEYVERQPEHHRTRTFQDEYRAFLERHQIDYDEQYVWD